MSYLYGNAHQWHGTMFLVVRNADTRAAATGVFASGGGDTTQDAMAKVLHERWLSEREKARTLEARLKDTEARMGDVDEVSAVKMLSFSFMDARLH